MRPSPLILMIPAVVLFSAGCAPSAPESGDVVGSSDALTGSSFGSCSLTREQILGSVDGARRAAIERGFTWLDADVSYSQSSTYIDYRTDCSGFVSMCWGLDKSYTTANFISGDGEDSLLGSYDDLQPGDALVHRSDDSGHIVLFLGWEENKNAACVLEQASTASDMQFRTRTTASLRSGGYQPVRADRFQTDPSDPNKAIDDECYSPTLDADLPEMTCVKSRSNGVWYQCVGGDWYRADATGPGPSGPCANRLTD